jgi:hypothetical protein
VRKIIAIGKEYEQRKKIVIKRRVIPIKRKNINGITIIVVKKK